MKQTGKRVRPARVLVPLTLRGATPPKLRAVAAQARALDACVTLLHVVDGAAPAADGAPAAEEAVVTFLGEVSGRLRREGVAAKPGVRYGSVAATINDVAREQNASMIIVGASEPKGLGRLLPTSRGGLVGAISREAPCPVLVVPRREPDTELDAAA